MDSEDTKTAASLRELTLFPTAVKMLQKIKEEQKTAKQFYGNQYKNTEGYIFTWDDGTRYDPDYISKLFKKAVKKFGKPELSLHKLRHTCGSLLFELGWDLKKVQYWLGHSDAQTTLNIYAHFNKKRLNGAAEDLARISESCDDLWR